MDGHAAASEFGHIFGHIFLRLTVATFLFLCPTMESLHIGCRGQLLRCLKMSLLMALHCHLPKHVHKMSGAQFFVET